MHFIIGKKCFKLTNAVAALVYTYRKNQGGHIANVIFAPAGQTECTKLITNQHNYIF